MADGNVEALEGEQTLAMMLEFLAQLQSSQQKDNVIKEIKEKVKKYITKDVDKFATEGATSGYLYQTIRQCSELRTNILNTEDYKYNTSQFTEQKDNISQHLINNVFALFGCLYYMYYECATECNGIKGGEWYDERCDGMGRYQYLNEWLRDETGGTKHMIQRGFKQEELSEKTGNALFGDSGSQALLDYLQGAQLQFCLYYMLFSPSKWNNAQSGHAVLYLQAFCEMVSGEQFKDMYVDKDGGSFKTACQTVERKISTLLKSEFIVPVSADNTAVKYNDLLQPEYFSKYIEWLKKNLENLIASLTEMANDAKNWDYTELISSETYGPYPWGFTFKDPNWDQKKGQLQQQLNTQLSQLNEELEKLKNALPSASEAKTVSESDTEKPSVSSVSINSAGEPSSSTNSTASTTSTTSNNSTNSAGSTIGGVAGGLGAAAATAGAAYAGSSFLGPVAEGVGKFVRGLLF